MTSSTDDSRGRGRRRAGPRTAPALLGQRPLRPDDALRDGRLGDEERARDLVGRQTAEQPQRERDARLGRQHRMARREHQPQQVVAHVVVERRVELGDGVVSPRLELVAELRVLALEAACLRRK